MKKIICKILSVVLVFVILSTTFLVPQAQAVTVTVGTAAAATAVVAAAAALGYVVVSNSDNWNLAASTWANDFVTRYSDQMSQLKWIVKTGGQVFAVWSSELWVKFTDWIKGNPSADLNNYGFRTTYSVSDFLSFPNLSGSNFNNPVALSGPISAYLSAGLPQFRYNLSNGFIDAQANTSFGDLGYRYAKFCPYLTFENRYFRFNFTFPYSLTQSWVSNSVIEPTQSTAKINDTVGRFSYNSTTHQVIFNNVAIAEGFSNLVDYFTTCFNAGNWIINIENTAIGDVIGAEAPPQVGIDYYPDRSTALDGDIGRDVVIPVAGDWTRSGLNDVIGHNNRTGEFTGSDTYPNIDVPIPGQDVFNPTMDDYAPTAPAYPTPIPINPPYGIPWPTAQPKPGVGYPPTVGNIPFPNVDVPPTVTTRPGDVVIPGTTDISDSIPNTDTVDTTIDIDIDDATDIPDTDNYPDNPPPSSNNDNTNKMKLSTIILRKFPFCIPIDFYNAIRMMVVDESPPEFEYTFDFTGILGSQFKYDLKFDFAKFDTLASVVKWFFSAMWVVALILLTRKLIWK